MTELPHVFADLDLSRRLEGAEAHANRRLVEARARVDPESGAAWEEIDGAYAMFDGVDSPITQTFGLGLLGDGEEPQLERMEHFFTSRGAAVHHEASPMISTALVSRLHRRGYRPIEFSSVMYRSISEANLLSVTVNPDIVVWPIAEDEAAIWTEINVAGWSHVPGLEDFLRDMAAISVVREDGVSLLAELAGEPIAAGAMSLAGGVCLLAGSCTVPEARRQGGQLALLDYRLRHAVGAGCDLAMMCAEPGSTSQRNAERHGFRIAYTRIKWALDAASSGE